MQTEYLLGDEPQWPDILEGRAIERVHDLSLHVVAEEIVAGRRASTALAITGTAGTCKSTALMSLAVKLSASGIPVLWIDKDSEVTPSRIRDRVREFQDEVVLAIDDADMYGRELVGMLRDLVPHKSNLLFVFAVRSGKLDQAIRALSDTPALRVHEHVVPPLADSDIDGLIAVLDKNKRLGKLTGASDTIRRQAFRDQAGRQLLVAMIQATSEESFEKKAQEEYGQLERSHKYPYALVAVATSLRYTVTRTRFYWLRVTRMKRRLSPWNVWWRGTSLS